MKHYVRLRLYWKVTYMENENPINMSKWTMYLRKVPHQLVVI